jgi:hypothetical protein
MGFLWALGGILAGTLAAVVAGVVLDYAQRLGWIVPLGEQWLLLPIVTGLAGFLGGLVSVSMYGRYLRSKGPAVKSKTKPAAVPKGLENVPGMPVFDVEAIRRGHTGAGDTPVTDQRPAPPPEQQQ